MPARREPFVRAHPDRPGVELVDPIENSRFALYTPTPVEPTDARTDDFYFPVDAAVAVESTDIEIPRLSNVLVRSADGDLVTDTAGQTDRTLPPDGYLVELTTTPMKVYLAVDAGLELAHGKTSLSIEFGSPTEVRIGARSFHEQPAGTITTPADPEVAMRAVSLFGSSLKTTSPERSFPTLRGHPPLVELGDSFAVPDRIDGPDTGVRLVIPPEWEYLYPAAPLAFYLGAEVVPGTAPRLVAQEFEHPLDAGRSYETAVHDVLEQVFFLDCVTRTEGYYQVDLRLRNELERLSVFDLDLGRLYDRSLAAQLEAYLEIPYGEISELLPLWHLTTDVTERGPRRVPPARRERPRADQMSQPRGPGGRGTDARGGNRIRPR